MNTISTPAARKTLTVALIGNPNVGKSTLFNALAGMQARVGNYPGVTVEKKIGRVKWSSSDVRLVDLPGTYSLSPRSLDELVTVEVLLGQVADIGLPDVVVCIADATNLERNLYLVSQVLDLKLPCVLVLNMWDQAHKRGIQIDIAELERRIGVPIVPTAAHHREGTNKLEEAVQRALSKPVPAPPRPFAEPFYRECELLSQQLKEWGQADVPFFLVERLLLDVGGTIENLFASRTHNQLNGYLHAARERLKEQNCRIPAAEAKVRYAWARETLRGLVETPVQKAVSFSDRLDAILTHRIVGLMIFAALMFFVFLSIYKWAEPLMGIIETGQELLGDTIAASIAPGAFRSLLVDGLVAGVGSVIVFVPQIAFLFFFIAVLEDCGYMSRAAFLMDKIMTMFGLGGKSFVPLMSSFACAVPGIMATRVIENRRDRVVTILVAPLMSCSARLPVYVMLTSAFVPAASYLGGLITLKSLVMFFMLSIGLIVAMGVVWVLKKTFFKGETPPFVMELPPYKWPSPRIVLFRVYDRVKAFVVRAGTLIFATTILVWAAGYFPGDRTEYERIQAQIEEHEAQPSSDGEPNAMLPTLYEAQNRIAGELIEQSLLGRMGHIIEPAVKPLGWDWKIGVGVIASFPAREVIIATLGTIYSLGSDVGEEDTNLQSALKAARWPDGSPVYTIPVALSVMVFFALCAQCAATLMIIRRETNSWRWPIFTFVYMTVLAYVAAWVTYQAGTALMS
ncbi:MAG: ferrous iron transport protein B [Planctomycetota bacterium]|nr:ferrous iron transport protein B [Planctomycetota bacterium]MDA1214033.1 ferrous iron transport protein B [Planctomycetota bacterium]